MLTTDEENRHFEQDWLLNGEAYNGLHTPGLLHRMPVSIRVFASFFLRHKLYALLVIIVASAVVSVLAAAAPAVHAGYMMLILVLSVIFNFIIARCLIYKIKYEHWETNRGSIPLQPDSDSDSGTGAFRKRDLA